MKAGMPLVSVWKLELSIIESEDETQFTGGNYSGDLRYFRDRDERDPGQPRR